MDLGLAARTYVVTGGTSGLGRAVAEALVAEGARVVVASRTAAAVEETAAALGDAASGVVADLTDPAAPQRLTDAALQAQGRLDGAFISHGGPPPSTALEVDEEILQRSLALAAAGPIRLLRHLGSVLGDGGSVVVLTSTSSLEPIAGLAGSNLARPAVWGYAKTLADELGPRGVRVNALVPGRFSTQRLQELFENRSASSGRTAAEERAAAAAEIPLRRIGDPAELGAVAAFLLSPRAGYVTGTAVRVDGGAVRGL